MYNSAATGGAICAIESTVIFSGYLFVPDITPLSVAFNVASYAGGGIYLYHSVLIPYPMPQLTFYLTVQTQVEVYMLSIQ